MWPVTFTEADFEAAKKCEPNAIDEHLMTVEQVALRYKTDIKRGLTQQQADSLLKQYGYNQLTPPPKKSEFLKFLEKLGGGFSLLLWIGALLCIISYAVERETDNLYLAIVLALVVIITGGFAYYQESKSSAMMESFKNLIPHNAHVVRDGILQEIDSKNVVVGDVIEVCGGNQVSADMRIFMALGCKFDNSSMTGESDPQVRGVDNQNRNPIDAENIAFFSTYCTEGRARGIAIRTGDKTFIGTIAHLSQQQQHVETTIAREIDLFIKMITIFAAFLGIVFFILALVIGYRFIAAVIFFIGIIVANVPEGLLATVTVCLTLTANELRKKNCLVKNLEAVETLGATSVICSDKTGTLTQNRMHASHLWFNNQVLGLIGNEKVLRQCIGANRFEDFLRVTALCSKATSDIDPETKKKVFHGDASETAFLRLLERINLDYQKIRAQHPTIHEIPFNSTNKFHLTVHYVDQSISHSKHKYLVCLKGAPEVILKICNSIILDGHCKKLEEDTKEDLNNVCSFFASMGERVLAFTEYYTNDYHQLLDTSDQSNLRKKFQSDMNFTLLGLISLIDPPRPEVPEAVGTCRIAGIRVFMVTGDHPITAQAIARQVGIISAVPEGTLMMDDKKFEELFPEVRTSSSLMPANFIKPQRPEPEHNAIVIPGTILSRFSDDQLDHTIANYKEIVFARASPQQKLLIVASCQRLGYTVAVTGDGVNDSPALKKANIGISMGIGGSDVSKEAADMILMDDNFATIVAGIEEGRVIFDNLKKSISYVLASNSPEIVPFLIYVILGFPLGLGTITILCVDLGTDILPSIALAYEKAESDVMKRPPRDPQKDHLVTINLFQKSYFQIGIIQAASGFLTYFCVMADYGFWLSDLYGIRKYWDDKNYFIYDRYGTLWDYDTRKVLEFRSQTAFFAAIVVCQWADLIICKTRINSIVHQKMENDVLNWSLVIETIIACFLVYCPGINTVFKLYPLRFWYWTTAIPFSIFTIVFDELRKYIIRASPGGFLDIETSY